MLGVSPSLVPGARSAIGSDPKVGSLPQMLHIGADSGSLNRRDKIDLPLLFAFYVTF